MTKLVMLLQSDHWSLAVFVALVLLSIAGACAAVFIAASTLRDHLNEHPDSLRYPRRARRTPRL